ncbi:TlpA family protein disulfide reductase [Adhaeribacter aquaticus]|uniref:TlpA family protein disulfide reductase n=1 Tax=Adhaeribacter aquaticus TaxID=299567 RepID=UPI0004157B58|nr:TlpA disulfide reductase family protein [Adhaeribacter aquaticus]
MKQLNLLLIFLLSSFSLFAQKAIVKGKVINPEQDSIMVAVNPNTLSAKEVQSLSAIDAQGQFAISVPVSEATSADFVYDEESISLFLHPGDELEVRFNPENFFKTLKFKGKGANENNFLVSFNLKFYEDEDYQILPNNIRLNEKSFVAFLDYRKKDQLQFLERHAAKTPLSEDFKNYIKAEIEYSWANDLLTFASLRQRVIGGSLIKLSPGYYDFLKTVTINNSQALKSHAYTSFLTNYLQFVLTATNHQPSNPDYYWALYSTAKEKLTGECRNLVLAQILHNSIQNGFIKYTDQIWQDLMKLAPNLKLNDPLVTAYNVNKAFALGGQAPDFKLKSIEGKDVSLKDFKGKVVYLNFWSTTCILCKVDLPYAKELEKEMLNKNIIFINIGVDGDEELWRKSVASRKLKGVQLFARNKEELLQKYKVVEAPAYFLIDTDGTFISTNAKRPSNASINNELLKALKM